MPCVSAKWRKIGFVPSQQCTCDALAMPDEHIVPSHGGNVWAASARGRRGSWRSNPLHVSALATVEDILVHATSSTFAGRRSNVSLGRSEVSAAGLVPLQAVAPTTTDVLWKNEEGNVVSMREAHALDGSLPKKQRHVSRTRPSLGPETRARQSALNPLGLRGNAATIRGVAEVEVSRSGKPAQAGGTGTGATASRTNARLAACHRSPYRRGRA